MAFHDRPEPVARGTASPAPDQSRTRRPRAAADGSPLRRPPANRLLAGLGAADLAIIEPWLRPVRLRYREAVIEPGQAIRHVYFPESGVLAEVLPLRDGTAVEVGCAGSEGMAGLVAHLGATESGVRTVCLVPGTFLRLPVPWLTDLARRSPAFDLRLRRYLALLLTQRAQSVACARLHSVESRLARWILVVHDRIDGDEFPVTHEFLALLLGARRPSVTVAAEDLQATGLIRYRRGHLEVLDRAGLEAASCECYWVVREEAGRLLGWVPGGPGIAWHARSAAVARRPADPDGVGPAETVSLG
jgi:CRP-like cAMP-binding protein